jgi:hypothetical protein
MMVHHRALKADPGLMDRVSARSRQRILANQSAMLLQLDRVAPCGAAGKGAWLWCGAIHLLVCTKNIWGGSSNSKKFVTEMKHTLPNLRALG